MNRLNPEPIPSHIEIIGYLCFNNQAELLNLAIAFAVPSPYNGHTHGT